MAKLIDIYRTPLALLTDLYQLTMAYGYWKMGRAEREAIFHLFFRKNPFGGGYTVAAGLQYV
ncbi:MAG TPA: nicotinate phosphoribosyltransferase, partial [Pirellulaceae bacterium]|nr:nicotinate phosphoribosyltransferase [Pirellulaceae bacterium]